MRSRRSLLLLAAIPAAYLAYFYVYPLVTILVTGLFPNGRFATASFVEIATNPTVRSVAWFTLWQAVISTLLTVLLGLPGAYVFARYRFPGRSLLRSLTLVPFVLPTIVVGVAFLAVLGPGGPFGLDLR
ncbi:MAG TPA: iron ABC transporter permease, partial [Acidimicrobiia bacterium]|nr:iron ABC transporter permease [Acidimicrobiia bacterium]